MEFDYSNLPEQLQPGFKAYVEEHHLPGGFITACLENNLSQAFVRADQVNFHRIYDIVRFLLDEAPMSCWGSQEKVKAWVKEGRSSG